MNRTPAMAQSHSKTRSGLNGLESYASCPVCRAPGITKTLQDYDYEYGEEKSRAMINIQLPVSECSACGFTFLDHEAEKVKHNALCRHFGVLRPDEIRDIRRIHKMSRAAFARATKLSEASLHRWENGLSIQTQANDQYLRLLRHTENMSHLNSVHRSSNANTANHRPADPSDH
ncbi:MAG: YgiT-type zinc finger protein [Rhodobacteraceae bacterium]|nr:YgiT-type zinc finger protein [Paracoccaceae bacterium]